MRAARACAGVFDRFYDRAVLNPVTCRYLSDVTLESDERVLIIDAKCYGRIMGVHNGREMMSPANRHQIVDYVAHEAFGSPKDVSGMLLYALTESEAAMHEGWDDIGHRFYLWTLDLGGEFSAIAATLDEAAAIVSRRGELRRSPHKS